MPDHHRPPEWQQNADRHTELRDPVLTVRQISRFEFNRKALTRIDHALVFTTPRGGHEVYLPPRRPSRSEVAARRYTSVYEVDMGIHPWREELALPSDNDAFEFGAEVDFSWQVVDPVRYVAGGHRDVPALLIGELQQAARPVTRRFPVSASAEAERELLRAMAGLGPLGATAGLQVTWTLRVRRDEGDIAHQRRLREIDQNVAEQIRADQGGMQADLVRHQRDLQQDALQISRSLEYGGQAQQLALQQQRWQHEQALLAGRQQLELQRVNAEKVAFYQWHLEQGGIHALALHLAEHPGDTQLVMENMRQDQLALMQSQLHLVEQVLKGDHAEAYELDEPKKLALRTMTEIFNQRLPGVPHEPPVIGPPPPQTPPYPGQTVPGQTVPETAQIPEQEAPAAPAPPTPPPAGNPYTSPPPAGPHAPPHPYAPPPPPWQAPPGYGTVPTAPGPAQPPPAPPAAPPPLPSPARSPPRPGPAPTPLPRTPTRPPPPPRTAPHDRPRPHHPGPRPAPGPGRRPQPVPPRPPAASHRRDARPAPARRHRRRPPPGRPAHRDRAGRQQGGRAGGGARHDGGRLHRAAGGQGLGPGLARRGRARPVVGRDRRPRRLPARPAPRGPPRYRADAWAPGEPLSYFADIRQAAAAGEAELTRALAATEHDPLHGLARALTGTSRIAAAKHRWIRAGLIAFSAGSVLLPAAVLTG